MRIFTVLVFMAAAAAFGQTARLGDLGPDSTVVTNAVAGGVVVESDPVAYPIATNALALAEGAVEHAQSAHGLTDNGGFAGGANAIATQGGAVGRGASATYGGGAVGYGASATYGGAVGRGAIATQGGAVGYQAMTSSGFAGGYRAMAALDNTGFGTPIDAIQLGTGWNPAPNTLQIYGHKLMNADGSIPAERMAATLSAYATAAAVAAVQAEVAGKQTAETVVSGAVGTATAGNRYFWTTATNVTLRVGLTGGQVINYAALRNTATNAITATASTSGWKWTGGSMTNSIPAGKMMTFGWAVDPSTGATNAYATAASEN